MRKELNYNGVVITGDMTMGAIIKNYSISSAAIKAVNEGVDIVLVTRGYDNEASVLNTLRNAVNNSKIFYLNLLNIQSVNQSRKFSDFRL